MATALPATMNLSPELASQAKANAFKSTLQSMPNLNAEASATEKDAVKAKLHKAAVGFETMFANMMLKEMMPEDSSLFGEGLGSKTFHQMFVSELGTLIGESGQLGLAESVERDVAAMAGLTDESKGKTDLIPGTTLQRQLPQTIHSYSNGINRVNSKPLANVRGANAINNYSFGEAKLNLAMPVDGKVSSEYGERKDPFTGSKRQHHGLDIAAPTGSNIKAAAGGKVTFSGEKPGYGNMVIIEHSNGYETRYAHNFDNLVRSGDTVMAGQAVAKVGSSGRSTGPHVHFELRQHGESQDPREHISLAD